MRFPCRARTIRSLYRESGLQSPQVRRIAGARMNTQWNGVGRPSTSKSASNDSRWRPNAFRSTAMSMSPRSRVFVFSACAPASLERRMHPAQVPMIGIASSLARRTISSNKPSFTRSFEIVVLSPPGIVSPSTRARSSGRRTAIASPDFPASRMARATASTCSLTSPWTPMTPIRIGQVRPRAIKTIAAGLSNGVGCDSLPLAVLPIVGPGPTDEILDDSREHFGVGEEAEALACDAAEDDLVPRMRGVARPQDLVAVGEHRFAHRGLPIRVRMPLVQRDDLEESIEQDRPLQVTQDRHAHAVHRRVQGRVAFKRLAVDSNLEQAELGGSASERRDVPVPERLDGECGCRIARDAGLSRHDGIEESGSICTLSRENPR